MLSAAALGDSQGNDYAIIGRVNLEPEEGFDGYAPLGWGSNGVGGISAVTYDQWRNRTFPYTVVDRDDFVEKVINSMDLCQFEPPVQRPDIVNQGKPNWELLTTHSRLAAARREVAEAELTAWVAARSARAAADELARLLRRTDEPAHRALALYALRRNGERRDGLRAGRPLATGPAAPGRGPRTGLLAIRARDALRAGEAG